MKVLVTNCTRNSGLTVMRALSSAGWNVEGADDRALAFGLRSRCAVTAYARLPHEDSPGFTDALLALLDRKQPDVMIPTRGIEAACRARDAVAARTRCLLPTPEAFEIVNDKVRLLERCAALNIAQPRVFQADEAVQFLKTHRVPRWSSSRDEMSAAAATCIWCPTRPPCALSTSASLQSTAGP